MELQTRDFLSGQDTDAVLAVVANLVAEVVDLQHRVAALEGGPDPDEAAQGRIDALVARVFSPLRDDPTLP